MFPFRFHHHLHELVLERPGRGLGNAQLAGELQARDGVLGLGKQVHGQEPDPERKFGAVEDGPCCDADLMAADRALHEGPGLQGMTTEASALRALKTQWPAAPRKGLDALGLPAEARLELDEGKPRLELDGIAGHNHLLDRPERHPRLGSEDRQILSNLLNPLPNDRLRCHPPCWLRLRMVGSQVVLLFWWKGCYAIWAMLDRALFEASQSNQSSVPGPV